MPEDSLEEYWGDLRRKPEPKPKASMPEPINPEQLVRVLRGIADSVSNPEPFFPSTVQEEIEEFRQFLDFNVEEEPLLTIRGAEGRMMVEIHSDGTLRFGESYTPNEAARIFWEAIAHFPRG